MTNQANNSAETPEDVTLAEESQVVDYLISNPDFFLEHATLLNDLRLQHESGKAISLIERQVSVLREKNQYFEAKLGEMVDAVHDNQRLHVSMQRLAINLFAADSLDDVLGIVDDELRHKLGADFVAFRLATDESHASAGSHQSSYVARDDVILHDFASLIESKKIQCGRLSDAQLAALFGDEAAAVKSAAVIAVSDAGIRGVIALGSDDDQRYHPGMGTDFLSSLADLISAALISQLPK